MEKTYMKRHFTQKGKRRLAFLVSLCLIGTMFPISVKSESITEENCEEIEAMSLTGFSLTGKPQGTTVKTINLNAAVLRPDSTWNNGGYRVYFGTYGGEQMAYRVLSSPNTQTTSSDSLLLDCDCILEDVVFSKDNDNKWTNSYVRNWLEQNVYNKNVVSAIERAAIAETTLSESTKIYGIGDRPYEWTYEDYSSTDHVFCLSAAEADGLYENNRERWKNGGTFQRWWLRSAAYTYENGSRILKAGCILHDNTGSINFHDMNNNYIGASPAFNVELSKVLFASEVNFDKAVPLAAITDSTNNKWKLTLLDSDKTVSVTEGQTVTRQGRKITIPYTYNDNNTTDPVSQISVMITDKPYTDSAAEVLYFGALEGTSITSGGASGTGGFTLPVDLTGRNCGTDYYAYIIAERVNGTRITDYASVPVPITIPAGTAVTEISSVEVTGIDTPVSGTELDVSAVCVTTGVVPAASAVTWTPGDTTAAYNTSYTASVTFTADTDYEFSDAVTATVNGNAAVVTKNADGTLTVTYTFSATAKENVGAPDASVPSGIYPESQKVELRSPTQGATIYYTTDGSEPSVSNGTKYTGLIDVTGVEGQSVTTTIKAIAVKESMQDSEVKTFTYTIEIPSQPAMGKPVITTHPQSIMVKAGETAEFTVAATGTDLNYQWQINRNDGNGFVNIGENRADYTTTTIEKDCDGFLYRCVISNLAGTVTTQEAKLTVTEDVIPPSATKYSITATAGANGKISPSGIVEVTEGNRQEFIITAQNGYEIDSLKIDGTEVTAVASYIFENVTVAHTIEVTFKQSESLQSKYKIIEGANSLWTEGADGSLSIRGDGNYSDFRSVKVDGSVIGSENYTVTEGSTIITLTAAYLNSLSAGNHTFEIVWTDGAAKTNITISTNMSGGSGVNNSGVNNSSGDNNNSGNTTNITQVPVADNAINNVSDVASQAEQQLATSPKTGEDSNLIIWLVLFIASFVTLAGIIKRRMRSNEIRGCI